MQEASACKSVITEHYGMADKNNRVAKKKFGAIAQLVEHQTENLSVGGSIPPRTTVIVL